MGWGSFTDFVKRSVKKTTQKAKHYAVDAPLSAMKKAKGIVKYTTPKMGPFDPGRYLDPGGYGEAVVLKLSDPKATAVQAHKVSERVGKGYGRTVGAGYVAIGTHYKRYLTEGKYRSKTHDVIQSVWSGISPAVGTGFGKIRSALGDEPYRTQSPKGRAVHGGIAFAIGGAKGQSPGQGPLIKQKGGRMGFLNFGNFAVDLGKVKKTVDQVGGVVDAVNKVRAGIKGGKGGTKVATPSPKVSAGNGPSGYFATGSGMGAGMAGVGLFPALTMPSVGATTRTGDIGVMGDDVPAAGFPNAFPAGVSLEDLREQTVVPRFWFRRHGPGILQPAGPIPKGAQCPIVDWNGDIEGHVVAHMNIPKRSFILYSHPESGLNPEVMAGLTRLNVRGYSWVRDFEGADFHGLGAVVTGPIKRRGKAISMRELRAVESFVRRAKRFRTAVDKIAPRPRRK